MPRGVGTQRGSYQGPQGPEWAPGPTVQFIPPPPTPHVVPHGFPQQGHKIQRECRSHVRCCPPPPADLFLQVLCISPSSPAVPGTLGVPTPLGTQPPA